MSSVARKKTALSEEQLSANDSIHKFQPAIKNNNTKDNHKRDNFILCFIDDEKLEVVA